MGVGVISLSRRHHPALSSTVEGRGLTQIVGGPLGAVVGMHGPGCGVGGATVLTDGEEGKGASVFWLQPTAPLPALVSMRCGVCVLVVLPLSCCRRPLGSSSGGYAEGLVREVLLTGHSATVGCTTLLCSDQHHLMVGLDSSQFTHLQA